MRQRKTNGLFSNLILSIKCTIMIAPPCTHLRPALLQGLFQAKTYVKRHIRLPQLNLMILTQTLNMDISFALSQAIDEKRNIFKMITALTEHSPSRPS